MAKIYCQCTMERNGEILVRYIPKRFAVEGKNLYLKMGGKWIEGWIVTKVGPCQEGNPDR